MSVLYIQPGEGQSPAVVKGPPGFLFPPFPSLGGGGGGGTHLVLGTHCKIDPLSCG